MQSLRETRHYIKTEGGFLDINPSSRKERFFPCRVPEPPSDVSPVLLTFEESQQS